MTRNDAPPPTPPSAASGSAPGEPVRAEVVVRSVLGLHTRPSTALAKRVLDAGCVLTVHCPTTGEAAQGDSIISLLSLGAPQHTRLVLEARGERAPELIRDLVDFFARGFDEPTS